MLVLFFGQAALFDFIRLLGTRACRWSERKSTLEKHTHKPPQCSSFALFFFFSKTFNHLHTQWTKCCVQLMEYNGSISYAFNCKCLPFYERFDIVYLLIHEFYYSSSLYAGEKSASIDGKKVQHFWHSLIHKLTFAICEYEGSISPCVSTLSLHLQLHCSQYIGR